MPDVTIDGFADVRIVSLYREFSAAEETSLVEAVIAAHAPRSIYLKRRPREARIVATTRKAELAPETPVHGEAIEALDAKENGLLFRIRPGQGLNVGLYLDMRETRAWLADHVQDKSVLNLFAYTCAFGVIATASGASRAVNVDASRRVLDWGEENAALNAQPVSRRDYLQGDAFDWLARFSKKRETFDVVILDPPSFSTTRAGRFSAEQDYARLTAAAAPVVSRGGLLIACCNHAGLTDARFDALLRKGLAEAGRSGKSVARLGPSQVDFPQPDGQAPALKVRALRL